MPERRTWVLEIPIDAFTLSPNARSRVAMANYRRAHAARMLAYQVWVAAGKPRLTKATLDVTIYRRRIMDADNATASLKGLLDGVFKKAMLADDCNSNLKIASVKQITGKAAGMPRVVFHVTEGFGE